MLEDADLNQTAYMATQSRLQHRSEHKLAKRFIVVKEVADKFTMLFVENTQSEVVGDPLDSKTTVGPLLETARGRHLPSKWMMQSARRQGANRWQGYQ